MKVKLKYGNVFLEEDSSNLPQDGARMISYLEEKGIKELVDLTTKTVKEYLTNDSLWKSLCKSVFDHIVIKGSYPKYFSTQFVLSSDMKTHSKNMKKWDNIVTSVFKGNYVDIKTKNEDEEWVLIKKSKGEKK